MQSEEILRTALGLENGSILFYEGLKDLVPARLGRDKVEAILTEEKRHVAIIGRQLHLAKS